MDIYTVPCGLKEACIFERRADGSVYYHCKARNHKISATIKDIKAGVPNFYISR